MTAIFQATRHYHHGRPYTFSLRWLFVCPAPDCEYWMHSTTEEGAVTLAYTHSVTAGLSVCLADLCSERVDEGMVQLARSIAAKVGTA